MSLYRGRFAPSPTGELHLGGACTALCAWLAARAAGGQLVLRVEDVDRPRVVPGSMQRILDDLRWLGLDWDEGPDVGGPCLPYLQSQRQDLYEAALDVLRHKGAVYPCDCSRAEIARIASAPHAGEEGPVYPGTCRSRDAFRSEDFRRPPAWRLRVPDEVIAFEDRVRGLVRSPVEQEAGDFVLRRGDGVFAYQMAVVVDDLLMNISEVVRGADLLSSTPRQILLARLLGGTPPAFGHAPLVVDGHGQRLAKRARGVALRDHRAAGADPRAIVAVLAQALGLASSAEHLLEPSMLVERFAWSRIPKGPVPVDFETLLKAIPDSPHAASQKSSVASSGESGP